MVLVDPKGIKEISRLITCSFSTVSDLMPLSGGGIIICSTVH